MSYIFMFQNPTLFQRTWIFQRTRIFTNPGFSKNPQLFKNPTLCSKITGFHHGFLLFLRVYKECSTFLTFIHQKNHGYKHV